MPMGIKASPWSTPAEIAEHDALLNQFQAIQIQRYGTPQYWFWTRAVTFIAGTVITAGIIIGLSYIR